MQGGLQNHPGPGQHRGDMPRGCGRQGMHLPCKQRHAGALPAISSAAHGSIFPWELPRLADCKSTVKKPVGRRPVEHYHQLPPFITPTPWVPKPKSSRRTVVNRVTSGCKSRRNRHGQNLPRARGRQKSAPLGTARHPGQHRGARPLYLPVAQEQSL